MKWIAISLACTIAGPAFAQDQCRDVLQNGAMQSTRLTQSDYYQQIIWSRFLRSTFENSKTDRSGGLTVPIGELILGANYSEEQYRAKKEQMKSDYFNQITATRELDVALSSGDPTIVAAWSDCMVRSGGGLSVRFEPVSDKVVFLIIEYRLQGKTARDRLVGDVPIPENISVSDPGKCTRRKAWIEAGRECRATLTLPSATTTLALSVAGQEDTAQAWLPARLKLVKEARPFVFSEADQLYQNAHKEQRAVSSSVNLTAEEIKAGWLFDPSTAQTGLSVLYAHRADCHSAKSEATSFRFTYGYYLDAPKRNHAKSGAVTCKMSPYILMRRDTWAAAGALPTIEPAPLN